MRDHLPVTDPRPDASDTHLRVRLSTRARRWLEAAAAEAETEIETLARFTLEHEAQQWARGQRMPPFDQDDGDGSEEAK